ncbi:retropepsin-like aspartic protease [Gluconacetobacter sp. Hr-1-5]|uniref:retropepsin-like aspartic protease n=1 Tax=Gluconacetobacter sp. Hr-1-5 TaxID=3395370 RepID=UPI003B52AE5E
MMSGAVTSVWRNAVRSVLMLLPAVPLVLPSPLMARARAQHAAPAAPPPATPPAAPAAGVADDTPPFPQANACIAHVLSLPLLTGEGSPGVAITLNAAKGMAFLSTSQEALGVFERPGLEYEHSRTLQMKTITGPAEAFETTVDRLALGRGTAQHVPAVTLGQMDDKVAGLPILGVVGYDILGNYDVLMDFPRHVVTLFKETGAAACPPLPALVGAHSYAALLMPNPQGMDVMVQVALNGALLGMQVEPGSNASIVRTADAADIGVGKADLAADPRSRTDAGNAIIGRRHRFAPVAIGTWHGASLSADVTNAQFNVLGMDFFRGRRVLFAFPTRMFYFSDVQPDAAGAASASLSLAQSRLADVQVQQDEGDTPPPPPSASAPPPAH